MNIIKILVIEDDPNDLKLLKRALRSSEEELFEITVADRLSCGLTSLSDGDKYDVVLLDLKLPDSGGMDTVQKVRDVCPGTAVIVLSGHTDDRIALQALRHGVDDYLVKTELNTSALQRTIRYSVERRRAQAQLRRTEQLEMLSQLTAAAMHEFSNLVQIISGNIDLLASSYETNSSSQERVERIKIALRRMTAIRNNLHNFTLDQSSDPLPRVDMGTALANIQKLIDRNSREGGVHV